MNLTFLGTIKDNKLVVEKRDEFILWIGQFEGKKIDIIVKKHRRKRTTGKPDEEGNQNGYLHGVIFPLCAKELGYTFEEMKEIFITLFSPYSYKDFGEKKVALKLRTSQMDIFQCKEFIDTIIIEMAKLGIIIPDAKKIN